MTEACPATHGVSGDRKCWFWSGDYDPDIFTLRAEVFGPYPPGSSNDPIWYFGGDSLRFWSVKVEVDEELSDRILDVPVDEDDEAETPVKTVFRILPDLGSSEVSFVGSPAAGVTYWHSVSYQPEVGDEVVVKAEAPIVLGELPFVNNRYTLAWEQKDDDENWLDPAHNPYTSRVTMRWERGETRQPVEARGDLVCDAAGVDLVVRLPDGSLLPEAQEQAPGSGVFVVLNNEHPTGSTMGLGEWPAVMAKMVPIDVRISAQTIEEFALSQEGAYFELSIEGSGAECVKVWEFGMPSYDRMEVLLDGTEQEYVRRWYPRNSEDARELCAMVLGGIYLEGARGPSTHIRDWSLELRVKASEVSREKRDRVEGTIIGVDLYRGTTHWGANNMESGNMFLLGQPLGIEIEGLHGVASAEVRVCRGESPELVVSAALTETANNVFRNAGADRPVFGSDDDLTMGRIGIEDEEDIQVSLSINGAAAAFPIHTHLTSKIE